MRRILILSRGTALYGVFDNAVACLTSELYRKGVDVDVVDITQPKEKLKDFFASMHREEYDAALAINATELNKLFIGEDNYFDLLNVPFINWIIDHPIDHHAMLIAPIKNYYVICLDRDHVSFVKRCYPEILGGVVSAAAGD